QALERVVVEDLPPRRIGERGGLGRGGLAAGLVGNSHRGTLVLGAGGAAGKDEKDGKDKKDEEGRRTRLHEWPSPAAGTRASASLSASRFLSAPPSFSTTTKSTGIRKTARQVAASMPATTTVPRIWRDVAPAPWAIHKGTQPRMKANE